MDRSAQIAAVSETVAACGALRGHLGRDLRTLEQIGGARRGDLLIPGESAVRLIFSCGVLAFSTWRPTRRLAASVSTGSCPSAAVRPPSRRTGPQPSPLEALAGAGADLLVLLLVLLAAPVVRWPRG